MTKNLKFVDKQRSAIFSFCWFKQYALLKFPKSVDAAFCETDRYFARQGHENAFTHFQNYMLHVTTAFHIYAY